MPRAAVIAPATSQPRYHRRVDALRNAGFDVTVYAFDRGYYTVNSYPDDVRVVALGAVRDGAYIRRTSTLFRATLKIRQQERALPPCQLWYAFGLDNALVASIVRDGGELVYEVGDLRNADPENGLSARFLWRLERHILRRVALLVATSPDFIHEHYRRLLPDVNFNWVVLENRVPVETAQQHSRPPYRPAGDPLRIGVIGLLRYEATLAPLMDWVSERPHSHELHVHGDGPLAGYVQEKAVARPNIHYHGPFRNPEDLASIYGGIDVCYSVYDNRDRNVRLALPNKLFEAPYFGVPVIAAEGTAFARRVRGLGVGVAVDPFRPDHQNTLSEALDKNQVDEMRRQAVSVPCDMLVEGAPPQFFGALAGAGRSVFPTTE